MKIHTQVLLIFVIVAMLMLLAKSSHARTPREIFPTYNGEILRVIDGDTVVVRVHIWPKIYTKVAVRLSGVDTPESSRRFSKCETERQLGITAKKLVKDLLRVGSRVKIVGPKLGKYAGRVVAGIKYRTFLGFSDLAEFLKKKGLARPYEGGKKSDWCNP